MTSSSPSSSSSRIHTSSNNGNGTIKLILRLDSRLVIRLLFLLSIGCIMLSSTIMFIKSEIKSIASTKAQSSNLSKLNNIINQQNRNIRRLSSTSNGTSNNNKKKNKSSASTSSSSSPSSNGSTQQSKHSQKKQHQQQQQQQNKRILRQDDDNDIPKIIDKKNVESVHQTSKKQFLDYSGDDDKHKQLDFLIAGFPKCGTTTLLYTFNKHKETSISEKEKCQYGNPKSTDTVAYEKLDEAISELNQASYVKRGIKCPTGIKTINSIDRLANHSPNTRIIIGLRHPVQFFQSLYNYRITEIYDKNLDPKDIPSIETLVGSEEWKGLSTDTARYEIFLMQLGKTDLSIKDLSVLSDRPNMAVKPIPFKVFLYTLEQIEDTDTQRSYNFRQDMQEFLQLSEPIPSFGHENLNNFVGKKGHPETIDICDDKFKDIRRTLVRQGKQTKEWLRDEFLNSKDVIAGGKDYFLELIEDWNKDPCAKSKKTKLKMKNEKQTSRS